MTTVAFFNGYYLPHLGGVERYTSNIAQQLLARGYRVVIVAAQHDRSLPNKETVNGVQIYRLPIHELWHNRYPFLKKNYTYRALIDQIRAENIDHFVVNTYFYQSSLLGCRLAAERGKEAIVIAHGSTYLTLGNRFIDHFLNRIERRLARNVQSRTTHFYGVSQETADWLDEFGIHASGVLFNAVSRSDFDRFSKRPDHAKIDPLTVREGKDNSSPIIISFAGRLIPKLKGVEILLSVFAQLSREHDNLELKVAGDGPLLKPLRKQYPQGNIHFLGLLDHDKVMELESTSDIFVLLSRLEGFSTSMLEAALLKNAIITTDVGGARTLLPDNSYGYIIERSETALKETLIPLIQNPSLLSSVQEKVSRRALNHFTWEKTADAFESVFKEMEMRTSDERN